MFLGVHCMSALATTHDIIQNKLSWAALFRPSDFFHRYRQEFMFFQQQFFLHVEVTAGPV